MNDNRPLQSRSRVRANLLAFTPLERIWRSPCFPRASKG